MKILFLGYSKLFKRRIIPVLRRLYEFKEIYIAKYKDQIWDDEYKNIDCANIVLYDSYEDALKKASLDIDLVYISTVNSTHYDLAKACLIRGWHTIIDKPIVLNIEELDDLIWRSTRIGQQPCLLSESLVYTYHPQFNLINDILKQYNSDIKTINVLFSIPPMEKNNFRYKKELGGGAINDMGPYAVSIGRYFFNEEPLDVLVNVSEKLNDVDIAFDVILKYSNDKSVIGHFGFTTEYINELTIIGNNTKIFLQGPVFSTPEHLTPSIKICSNGYDTIKFSTSENNFYLYFKDVLDAINKKDLDRFKQTMLIDCKTLDKIRHKI